MEESIEAQAIFECGIFFGARCRRDFSGQL